MKIKQVDQIIIFGTGSGAKKLLQLFEKGNNIYRINILAFTDNNDEKWNGFFGKYPIISPQEICHMKFDFIIVASNAFCEIKRDLINKYKINESQVIYKYDYCRNIYAKTQYELRYQGDENLQSNQIDNEKIIVYTANFGNYDNLVNPVREAGIDYVYFTDNLEYTSTEWEVNYVDTSTCKDLRKEVRRYKFFPYKFLKSHEISVWVDSSLLIKGGIREYVKKYLRKSNMLCFPHPERDCIYEEAKVCMELKLDNVTTLEKQIAYYREKYEGRLGLASCGCLVRRSNADDVKKVMQDWWIEIEKYSKRDQISFPYVCWKNHFVYDICDMNIYANPIIEFLGHKTSK